MLGVLLIENGIKIIELLSKSKCIGVGVVNCTVNIEFQLSELFAYLNTEIFGAGQRVWTIEVRLYV